MATMDLFHNTRLIFWHGQLKTEGIDFYRDPANVFLSYRLISKPAGGPILVKGDVVTIVSWQGVQLYAPAMKDAQVQIKNLRVTVDLYPWETIDGDPLPEYAPPTISEVPCPMSRCQAGEKDPNWPCRICGGKGTMLKPTWKDAP